MNDKGDERLAAFVSNFCQESRLRQFFVFLSASKPLNSGSAGLAPGLQSAVA
jgi:hypothetical protein